MSFECGVLGPGYTRGRESNASSQGVGGLLTPTRCGSNELLEESIDHSRGLCSQPSDVTTRQSLERQWLRIHLGIDAWNAGNV
jgi:hypothetical protein